MTDSEFTGARRAMSSGPPARRDESLRLAIVEAAPAVRRYLFGLCGHWHEAEDLAQESLLKAWARRETFDGRAAARTWIFAIARNCWLSGLRSRRVRPQEQPRLEESAHVASSPSPAAAAGRAELAAALEAAMARLPHDQREALALRESSVLTFEQIGRLLEVPTSTVKSRVRYALKNLAEQLRPFAKELEA